MKKAIDTVLSIKHNECIKTLSREKQVQIVAALVEGNSLRATARMCNVAFNTVLNFLPRLGMTSAEYQDKTLRGLKCKRVQADECWSFCYAKDKNLPADKQGKFAGWRRHRFFCDAATPRVAPTSSFDVGCARISLADLVS